MSPSTAFRPRSRRSAVLAVGLISVFGLAATACAGTGGHGGQLLIAEDTSGSGSGQPSTSANTSIWAVSAGEQPSDDNRLGTDVSGPLYINDLQPDGGVVRNLLASEWSGSILSAFVRSGTSAQVTLGNPGTKQAELASSSEQVQPSVLRRGIYIATSDGCKLARSADDVADIGTGLCAMSEDERWVVSWPAKGGELTIRDLRKDTTRTVKGVTTDAVVLGHGATVLAVQQSEDGARGVVIDATSGKVVGSTDAFDSLRPMPIGANSTGFVALATSTSAAATVEGSQLLWIDTDATVRVIDRGTFMLPVQSDSTVTYVHFGGQSAGSDSIRRWDSGSGERTTLLSGAVGATAVRSDMIVATKDTDAGVEIYRSNGNDQLERVTTVPLSSAGGAGASGGGGAGAGAGATDSAVDRIITLDNTTFVSITVDGVTSLVRVDLAGDGSDVPIKGWASMLLDGVDSDRTALVTGAKSATATVESIGVVTPGSDTFTERSTARQTGLNLIHEGVIYLTDRNTDGELIIRTVRAQGEPRPEILWTGYQLAGSTWPTDNGGTQSTLISRVAVLAQQSQQARQ